ncbi:hypothetical protein ACWCQZ_47265 [Streptomyces sp. NPDC002285]
MTGGNRGIGLAVAEAFREKGYRVAVTHEATRFRMISSVCPAMSQTPMR